MRAAVAAGGRIVVDAEAPGSWILADRAGNKAADDREPGSGDYDPVKAEAKPGTPAAAEKAAAEQKAREAAAGVGRLPDDTDGEKPAEGDAAEGETSAEVTDATEPPDGGDAGKKKPTVQKATTTREVKGAKPHEKKKHD